MRSRTSEAGPTHLFTHDFATSTAPVPQARDNRGVDWYRWAPDGTQGVAIVDGNPLLLTPGSSARDVAAAIAERIELGERESELTHRPCAAGINGECLEGWMTVDGARYARHGIVVQAGESIVWIDVSAPESAQAETAYIAAQVLSSLRWSPRTAS